MAGRARGQREERGRDGWFCAPRGTLVDESTYGERERELSSTFPRKLDRPFGRSFPGEDESLPAIEGAKMEEKRDRGLSVDEGYIYIYNIRICIDTYVYIHMYVEME